MKILMWCGGFFLLLVAIFALSAVIALRGKANWDDRSEEHARTIVGGLSELSREQFEKYWGDSPPGTLEQRESLIRVTSGLGVLKQFDNVERVKYMSKVTFSGVYHFYIYDVYTTYSNSPVRFRFWFRVHGDNLDVQNMNLYWGAAIDQDKEIL